ncbi:PaaI family thioesterase [Alkalihalobacillus sp. BA299]|uniref:PaaI family thioesterase n=1 Tax=Alkalihalobacillus sp. BA299 TaxID=2815938 RepID=UPI001ADA967B|nr:PaaI family thioesterase [Alkalihalobacillus sp. BA299]
MSKALENLQKLISGEISPPPIAKLLGLKFVHIEYGRSVFEMECDTEKHANPMGTIHGGILCDLADVAMGTAYNSTLDDGETFTTVELKINFLKPVCNEKLTAKAEVKKRGKSVGLVHCDIFNESGKLVAYLTSTCMTLRGEEAKGHEVKN